jgi:hypothetical protein
MSLYSLCQQIISTYRKHGWALRRVLLRQQTRAELSPQLKTLFNDVTIKDAEVDAFWFARNSHEKREAWELRLISETQYALFETFEIDEPEEDREDLRLEMEARLRDYATARLRD